MKSKILLINFEKSDAEYLERRGIECHLGYLSDSYELIGIDKKEEVFDYYFPLAIYEYKTVFLKLTKNPPLTKSQEAKQAKTITQNETSNFLKFWRKKGVLVIFLEDNNFRSFSSLLGFGENINLIESSGKDLTVKFAMNDENRPFRHIFKEIKPLINIPPTKYIEVGNREGSSGNWQIINIYENLNDQALGVYFNDSYSYTNKDIPSFVILPGFKDYKEIIFKLLKSFANIYTKLIPEIDSGNWVDSDQFYPKEVAFFDEQIIKIKEETKSKIENLTNLKFKVREKYSFLRKILSETGDELKDAVIKVFIDIWKLNIKDMDSARKSDFREDLLIEGDQEVLGEVKGTQNSNPSFTYVTQLLTHLLKSKNKEAIGALILNHDLKKNPEERSEAYTNLDEEEELKNIIFIDTRVLFQLSIAIMDYGLDIKKAKDYLLKKGRVTFDINDYLKDKLENNKNKK